MNYETIKVRYEEQVCYLQLFRPDANNTINDRLIEECRHVLSLCEEQVTIVVLEGLSGVFCMGADFGSIHANMAAGHQPRNRPEPLYDLWLQLAAGPYVTIAHVRGKANAGGVGFAAACDIVLADDTAEFSLSELLFGLFPACVMPFLFRLIVYQRSHYLTFKTKTVQIHEAQAWGLSDAYDRQSEMLVRRHLLRL